MSDPDTEAEDGTEGETEDAPELMYDTLDAWFSDFLAHVYARDLGQSRVWCPEWWLHPEAVYRLDALWRSWEHLRLDGALGPSVWLRDHLDPHMAQLMSPDGPFKGCDHERGHRRPRMSRLPGDPPDGFF
ncbi:MAG: DUF4913 domain-containing protein [Microbacteriaceae bacterium]|nr:hypothetical protein CZ771_00045 [Actinomycetales bacterium JB111]